MHNNQTEHTNEELFFQDNIAKLSKPIADFVNDFKTWPKEDQDKIEIYKHEHGQGFFITGRPAASDKYNGSIGYYLDCRLSQQQISPFLSLIDYIKQQAK